jgi:hypothetical protein
MAGEAVVSAITARRYSRGLADRSPDSGDPADQPATKEADVHWYADVIRRYTDFDGRADRPEFWWFALINLIISLVIWSVGIASAASTTRTRRAGGSWSHWSGSSAGSS